MAPPREPFTSRPDLPWPALAGLAAAAGLGTILLGGAHAQASAAAASEEASEDASIPRYTLRLKLSSGQIWQYDALIRLEGEDSAGAPARFELRGVLERRVERKEGGQAWIVSEELIAEEIEAEGAFAVIRDYLAQSLTRTVRVRTDELGKASILGRDSSGIRLMEAALPQEPVAVGDEWMLRVHQGLDSARPVLGRLAALEEGPLLKLAYGDSSSVWVSPEDGAMRRLEQELTETIDGTKVRVRQELKLLGIRQAKPAAPASSAAGSASPAPLAPGS